MKNLLSIGEVSKIKNVSHRMLRYYDKLGILIPIFVNEETGYRFYSKSQMIILDLILMCTALGIPLKKLNTYIAEDGSYDTLKILSDGQKLANRRLKQINDTIFSLNSMKQHFQMTKFEQNGLYSKKMEERYFITEKTEVTDYSIESYWESLSRLFTKIEEQNLTSSINQGQCYIINGNAFIGYIYIEIAKPDTTLPNLLTIPSGEYICEIFEDEDFELALNKYVKPYPNGSIIIVADVIEKQIRNKILPFEVQILKK